MTSGMLSLRAGVRTGRLAASLSRIGCSSGLTHFRRRIVFRLIVLTVHVFNEVRRIVLRERADSAALSTLSKGSICDAIWRAAVGLTHRGVKHDKAEPERWEVATVGDNADWVCLFLGGWNPSLISPPHYSMGSSAEIFFCVGNQVVLISHSPHPRSDEF